MTVRFVAGIALLVVGLVLPVVALVQNGKPWGFRGHAAVLMETSGTVELQAGEASVKAKKLAGEPPVSMKPEAGMFLEVGDRARVAKLSEARLKFQNGNVTLGDGTHAAVTATGLKLMDGALDVEVLSGTMPFVVEIASPPVELRVRPAAESGQVRIISDGKSEVRAYVARGSVEGTTPGGAAVGAEGGRMLAVSDGKVESRDAPKALEIKTECDGDRLTVEAPPATQVFAMQKLAYPEQGKVVLAVNGANEVPVFAKDVVGNVARVTKVLCLKVAPLPAPKSPKR